MSTSDIKEYILLKVQSIFFGKYNILSIFFTLLVLFLPAAILLGDSYDIKMLNNLVNGDLFNSAGIMAGFVFTGLSFICVSDSPMINNLKETGNFIIIKRFYTYSIGAYISVILLYLFKPIIINDKIIKAKVITKCQEYLIIIYLLLIVFIFVFACILFLFCLYVLYKKINE